MGCTFCNSGPADISQLFLFCPFAMEIWSWWWSLWNISWVWPKSLELALMQWNFPRKDKFFKQICLASFVIIIWSVWRKRNDRIFNKKSASSLEIKNLVLVQLRWWIKSWRDPFFLRNPRGSFSCPFPPMHSNTAALITIHRATQISVKNENFKNQAIYHHNLRLRTRSQMVSQ